jgi:hypothetical protein
MAKIKVKQQPNKKVEMEKQSDAKQKSFMAKGAKESAKVIKQVHQDAQYYLKKKDKK